jgi:hypothetical protein
LLNTPQRPSQPPQRNDLLFLFFAQDIHLTEGKPHVIVNVLGSAPLAGFQVTLIGRFWVIPEARLYDQALDSTPHVRRPHLIGALHKQILPWQYRPTLDNPTK